MRAVVVRSFGILLAMAAFSALGSGCNKDEPKKIPTEENKAKPIPSDMVFNDFLPQGTGGAAGMAVRVDGGVLEAGAPSETGSAGGTPPDTAAAQSKTKVTEPGAEPRAVRRYAFVPNKTDRRVLTMRQTMSAQGQAQEQPPVQLTVEFTPKEVKPTGTKFDVKLVKVDLADKDKLDPRLAQAAAQQFAPFAGLKASVDVSPQGEAGEVSMAGDSKMQGEAAVTVLEMLQQSIELAFAPLPDVPVGLGGKWEREESSKDHGAEESGKRTFEFKELTADGGTIVSTMEKNVPKRAYPDPRMRGATVEIHGSGTYTYVLKFDHVPQKIVGDQIQDVKIEVPSPDGKGERQSMVQQVKIKHLMESK